jgi:hypothetical protein
VLVGTVTGRSYYEEKEGKLSDFVGDYDWSELQFPIYDNDKSDDDDVVEDEFTEPHVPPLILTADHIDVTLHHFHSFSSFSNPLPTPKI